MQTNDYEIPEEKLKEWEEFLAYQTSGGMNYAMVAGGAALSLLQAYRKQREEIERLTKGYDALSKMMVTWIKEDQEKEECHER